VGRLVALLLIGFAVALYLRSRRAGADTPEYSPAEELRTKLAEARAGEDEPEAEPGLEHDLETRRREVHERARGAMDDLG
jgi:hypothetical protein